MRANRGRDGNAMRCGEDEVSGAGHYAWHGRAPRDRAQECGRLVVAIERVHVASGETYGSPRVTRALRQLGYTIGENRVARLMRERRLKARAARLYRANPANHAFFSIPNRQLAILAQQPDQVWVGDITYWKVGTAWRYLDVVVDKWSSRLV